MDATKRSYSCIYSREALLQSARLQFYPTYLCVSLPTKEVMCIPIQYALQFSLCCEPTFPHCYLLSLPMNQGQPFLAYVHEKDISAIHCQLAAHRTPFHLRPDKDLLGIRAEAFWVRDVANIEHCREINRQTEIDFLCTCTFNGRTGCFVLGVRELPTILVVCEKEIVNVVSRKAIHDVRDCVVSVGQADIAVFQFSSDARAFHYQFQSEPMDVEQKPPQQASTHQQHTSVPTILLNTEQIPLNTEQIPLNSEQIPLNSEQIPSNSKILHQHAIKLQQESQLLIEPVFSRNYSLESKVLSFDQVSVIQEEYDPGEEENIQRRLPFNQPPNIDFNQQPTSISHQLNTFNEQSTSLLHKPTTVNEPTSLFNRPQIFGSGCKYESLFQTKNEGTPQMRSSVGLRSQYVNSAEQSQKKLSQGQPTGVKRRINFQNPSRIQISIYPTPYPTHNEDDGKLENGKLGNIELENSLLKKDKLIGKQPEKETKLKQSRFESLSKRGRRTEGLISPVRGPQGGRDYLTRRSSRKEEESGSCPISVLQINHNTVASLAGYLHLRVDEVTRLGSQIKINSLIPMGVMPRRLLGNGRENVSLICANSVLQFSMEQTIWSHSYPIGDAIEGKVYDENSYALMGSDWLGLLDRRSRRMSLEKHFNQSHFQKIDTHGHCLIVGQQQSLLKIYDTRKLGRSHNNFELGTDQEFKSVEVTPKGNIFCHSRDAFLIDSMGEQIYDRTVHYSDRPLLHRFTEDGAKMFSISNCEKELASLSEGQVTLANEEGRRVIDIQGCFYVRHQRYAASHRVILGYTEKDSYSFRLQA